MRRRRFRLPALLLFASLVTGCTTGHHPPVGTSGGQAHPSVTPSPLAQGGKSILVLSGPPVPWDSTTPSSTPAPTVPSGIPPCDVGDLTIDMPTGMQGATAGQMVGQIAFRNTGTRACTLRGYPRVTLIDSSGNALPAPEPHPPPRFSPIQPRPPTWPTLLLARRRAAVVFVESSNWCGPRVAAWRVSLPSGGSVDLPRGWTMGVCEFPASPSALSVGWFAPPIRQSTKWPFVPLIFGWPFRIAAGAILHYVMTLENVPRRTYHFPTTCPPYVERLTQHGRVIARGRYVLNCRPAGQIPGGVAVRFAMVIAVPAATSGAATLTWTLDPPYGFSRSVPVIIGRDE